MSMPLLKTLHTLIIVVNATAIFTILYCGLKDRRGPILAAALIVFAAELVVLASARGNCPLQLYARQLEGVEGPVSDTLLPDWAANNIVTFFTPIALVGLGLVLRNERRRAGKARKD